MKPYLSRLVLQALVVFYSAGFTLQARADAALESAIAQFNRARQGETGQLDAAVQALKAKPANPALQPVYTVYLGSAHALMGKAAWMPWSKLKFTEQGLDHIDTALAGLRPEHDQLPVQGVPASLLTRLVAATTFIAVPDSMFHRRAAGKAVLAEIRKSPALAGAPAGFRADVDKLEASLKEAEK